jgi:hypothetical protein
MCRNIKTLHNFMPPATEDEVRASSLQFVRKLSGFTKPSKANEEAFNRAVEGVTQVAKELLESLTTQAPPRDREVEAAKAKTRSAQRFGSQPHTHADGHTHTHPHEHDHEHEHEHEHEHSHVH